MRYILLALLLLAAPVQAAPICMDNKGIATRCGAPGANPVSWQPSKQQMAEWSRTRPPGPSTDQLLKLALGLAALFALIALMPKFDGAHGEDWEPPDSFKDKP